MGIVYCDIAVSADGFAAGLNQREEQLLGEFDGNWLHRWMFDACEENRAEVDAIVDSGAMKRARAAAGDRNISIAGGAPTVNQCLAASLLDEPRLHVTASSFGAGERVVDGVPPHPLERVSVRATSVVTHMTYRPSRQMERAQ